MMLFRFFLGFIALAVVVYTIPVIQSDGLLTLFPSFFGEILSMSWQGQFNTDFLAFLLLSAFWTCWRNNFSLQGVVLGIGAFFLGAPYLAFYLIYLSYVCKGDIESMLLGDK